MKKKRNRLKRVSIKQESINNKYRSMLSNFDRIVPKVCTGCGEKHPVVKLSHSHIISRKHCHDLGRPDLIYNPDNVTFHCLSIGDHKGCHEKWESKVQRKELLDYEKNTEYIKSIDEQLYYRYTL